MKKKKEIMYIIILSIVGLVFLYFFGQKERNKKSSIYENGIETTGMITNKGVGRSNGRLPIYSLHFKFIHEGDTIYSYQDLGSGSSGRNLYDQAFIGRIYMVRYLPESPSKNAEIYIDEPVLD